MAQLRNIPKQLVLNPHLTTLPPVRSATLATFHPRRGRKFACISKYNLTNVAFSMHFAPNFSSTLQLAICSYISFTYVYMYTHICVCVHFLCWQCGR